MGIRYTNTTSAHTRDLWVPTVSLRRAFESHRGVWNDDCGGGWITTAAFERDDRGCNNGRNSGELCVVGVVGVVVVDAREVDVVGARETERAQVSRETVGFKRPVDGVARGGA